MTNTYIEQFNIDEIHAGGSQDWSHWNRLDVVVADIRCHLINMFTMWTVMMCFHKSRTISILNICLNMNTVTMSTDLKSPVVEVSFFVV